MDADEKRTLPVKLCDANLEALPERVARPNYDRSNLSPGIVHIGVGNFHRAHQATYLDRLFQANSDHDWGIIGAGIRPEDIERREDLLAQDCLTTVVELDPTGYRASVCGSMIDYLPIGPIAIVSALARPEVRIVSLTITEGGYFIDDKTGEFSIDHPEIRADIENANRPESVFGILFAGLRLRRQEQLPPFTIVSCDNIPNNGDTTHKALVAYANCIDPDIAKWVADEIATPNCMVDCITPAAGARESSLVTDNFNVKDAHPVVCEPFRQWVIEDRFSAGRPALERVGVEFVNDVEPYDLMKLRVLNGGHAAVAYAGALLGYHFVHDAMDDPLLRAFVDRLARDEIIPTLTPIPGVDFHAYLRSVLERFSNPEIGDTIPRLCRDGSHRQPKFILPTLAARLSAGQPIEGLALEIALWCRFCLGESDDGSPLVVEDENAKQLFAAAQRADSEPAAFLAISDIFGSLGENRVFAESFARALQLIRRAGTVHALECYLSGQMS